MTSFASVIVLLLVSSVLGGSINTEEVGGVSVDNNPEKEEDVKPRQYYIVNPGAYTGWNGLNGLNGGFQPNIYGINRPLGLGQSGSLLQPGFGGYGIQGYQVMPQMVFSGGVPTMAFATGGVPAMSGGVVPGYASYGYGHGGYGGHGFSGGGGHGGGGGHHG